METRLYFNLEIRFSTETCMILKWSGSLVVTPTYSNLDKTCKSEKAWSMQSFLAWISKLVILSSGELILQRKCSLFLIFACRKQELGELLMVGRFLLTLNYFKKIYLKTLLFFYREIPLVMINASVLIYIMYIYM